MNSYTHRSPNRVLTSGYGDYRPLQGSLGRQRPDKQDGLGREPELLGEQSASLRRSGIPSWQAAPAKAEPFSHTDSP